MIKSKLRDFSNFTFKNKEIEDTHYHKFYSGENIERSRGRERLLIHAEKIGRGRERIEKD